MGLFDSLFRKKHQTEIGKDGEVHAKSGLAMSHDKVRRAPVGSDFETIDRDPITGKEKRQRWEVKVNDSRLSERQKQTKGLKVIRLRKTAFGYQESVENRRGDKLEYNYLTGRHERVPKAQKNDPFGLNTFSSHSPKPRSRKANNDPFGLGSMLSSSSSTSRRKSRKSDDDMFGMNDMFGNGASSGRKRKRKNDPWGF